ncbi:MAG: V-type ATPase subunit [Promethearchaeota archaeon]
MSGVIVPEYSYLYVKLAILKQIVLNKSEIVKIQSISSIDELIDFLKPYYPDTSFKVHSISEIEKSLYHSFFKLIGKILANSSDKLRQFLKYFLMKYEIYNIKNIILDTILKKTKKEKIDDTNFLIEELLDNENFIRDLIDKHNINEIQLFMKKTNYYQVIKEGLDFYKKNQDIFVLAVSLDKLYYENLSRVKPRFSNIDFEIIKTYINYVVEIYNLKILYRGIKNNIEKNLLSQLLVNSFLFLNSKKLNSLLNQETIEGFNQSLITFLSEDKSSLFPPDILNKSVEDISAILKMIYDEYFFKECLKQVNSLVSLTVSKVLEVLVKKESEIKDVLIPLVVNILYLKYQTL